MGTSVAQRFRRSRALVVVGGAAVVVLLAAGAWLSESDSAASSLPSVRFAVASVDQVEGDAGLAARPIRVTLSAAARTTVRVTLVTVDGSATVADADYTPVTRTLSFAPGETSVSTSIAIRGDTLLEDYEQFAVRLHAPVGAVLGRPSESVRILNDDRPHVIAGNVRVGEGGVAVFKIRTAPRYYRPVVATVATMGRSATAPGDYTSVLGTVTIPAGSAAAVVVPVATMADSIPEGTESFGLRVGGFDVANTVTATATVVETGCPTGAPVGISPTPAPPSPSSALQSGPPTAVTNGALWDPVFTDEFDDPAATARKWSTGMRNGSRSLDANHELEWYSPANSRLTTDSDGTRTVSVLRQHIATDPVVGAYYPVGTLSRLYPPARCPQYYDAKHVAASDASLVPYRYRSGMLNSARSFGFKYGYVEARVKMPKGFGLWPALWLRDWHAWSYEIDALEGFDRDARVFRSTYWWGNGSNFSTSSDGGDLGVNADGRACRGDPRLASTASSPTACSLANSVDLSAGYHTIGLNWTPTKYEIYLDGVRRWSSPIGAKISSAYNHLILDLAFGNDAEEFDWSHEMTRPLDAGLLDVSRYPKPTVEWDYVRVWQPADRHAVCTTGTC